MKRCNPAPQLESVAECAAQLGSLSKALDLSDLRLDGSRPIGTQELARLRSAALGADARGGLVQAWGLIFQANHHRQPQRSGTFLPFIPR